MKATILQGHVLDRLKELPDESVQCCVTSPPFWGLRDYGTATWEGGAAGCDHRVGGQVQDNKALGAITTGQRPGVDASRCKECGAVRVDQQIGLERTPEEYVAKIVSVFREVRRVLRGDGTLWLNLGDSYAAAGGDREGCSGNGPNSTVGPSADAAMPKKGRVESRNALAKSGIKPKDLVGVPWMIAFALRADGWYLRSEIIWAKPNPMPESVRDRPTKAHEQIFLLSKLGRYYYDADAISENAAGGSSNGDSKRLAETAIARTGGLITGGTDSSSLGVSAVLTRNKRSVWEITTQPFPEAHFATFPEALVEPCILAGTSEHGACSQCGAPWKRIVDVNYSNPGNRTTNGPRSIENRDMTAGFDQRLQRVAKTTGWQPTCSCESADMVPCVVLDPFAGSGTTGVVALRYHRNFIGIELNESYAEMARRRIDDESPLFNQVQAIENQERQAEELPLFANLEQA